MNVVTEITNRAPGKSEFVETSLGKLHVVDVGSGEDVIVLWPSIFTDHRIYDVLIDRLGHRHRFLLIDGPGHGLSEGPATEFSMLDCAKAMAAILDFHNLESAVVGGTSWGGMTGAELALVMPDRVKALVLMNTPMEIGNQTPSLSSRMIAFGARWMLSTNAYRNGVAGSFFSKSATESNPKYMASFHDMLRQAKQRQLAAAIRSVLLRGNPLKNRLHQIIAPTLVIAGKEDAMYPLLGQAEAALLMPHGHFEPMAGKHISVVEEPHLVAEAISRFLERSKLQ